MSIEWKTLSGLLSVRFTEDDGQLHILGDVRQLLLPGGITFSAAPTSRRYRIFPDEAAGTIEFWRSDMPVATRAGFEFQIPTNLVGLFLGDNSDNSRAYVLGHGGLNSRLYIGVGASGAVGGKVIFGKHPISDAPLNDHEIEVWSGGISIMSDVVRPLRVAISTIPPVAPGPGFLSIRAEPGTTPGTAKLVCYAGASVVGTTIVDNVGSGV